MLEISGQVADHALGEAEDDEEAGDVDQRRAGRHARRATLARHA